MVEITEAVDINLLAVVVATMAFFIIGAIWYSPLLFGKQWMAAAKLKAKDFRQGASSAYIGSFLSYLVAIFALSYLLALLDVRTAAEGVAISTVISVGILTPISLANAIYHKTRRLLWAINTGYAVVGLGLAGAILGTWQLG